MGRRGKSKASDGKRQVTEAKWKRKGQSPGNEKKGEVKGREP